jgi:hypothetical protein
MTQSQMTSKPASLSLTARVALFTLAIFMISIWSLLFYASRVLREDMQQLIADQQYSSVSLIAADIEAKLDLRTQALRRVADLLAQPLEDNNYIQLTDRLRQQGLLTDFFNSGAFVVLEDGKVIADGVTDREEPHYPFARELAVIFQGATFNLGRPQPVAGRLFPQFDVIVPIRNTQGRTLAALVGRTDLNRPNFLSHFTEHQYGKTGAFNRRLWTNLGALPASHHLLR